MKVCFGVFAGKGMSLMGGTGQEPMWKLPAIPKGPTPAPNTPKIVDLDVSQRMRAAQRALKRICYRPQFSVAQAGFVDYHDVQSLTANWQKAAASDDSAIGTESDSSSNRRSIPPINAHKSQPIVNTK